MRAKSTTEKKAKTVGFFFCSNLRLRYSQWAEFGIYRWRGTEGKPPRRRSEKNCDNVITFDTILNCGVGTAADADAAALYEQIIWSLSQAIQQQGIVSIHKRQWIINQFEPNDDESNENISKIMIP